MKKIVFILLYLFLQFSFFQDVLNAQFLETFEQPPSTEWITPTGDGNTESDLEFQNGHAEFKVDATDDRRNIWWAIMQTTVSDPLDLDKLSEPEYELRIETSIQSSHAPRRVNLHVNTQRTTDFHTHLMEFDIPDTTDWHTISVTTKKFDGRSGDTINAHLALMDWGNEIYRIKVDYFKVDIVEVQNAVPDKGEQVLYPPPVPKPDEFSNSFAVTETAVIDKQYAGVNFSGWQFNGEPVLTTDGNKIILFRWDFNDLFETTVSDYGMLELTLHSFALATSTEVPEFDQLRLVEVLDGDPAWNHKQVTFNRFTMEESLKSVLNPQMIIDIDLPQMIDKPVRIHIPRPVVQRLLDGNTKGIALYPLGASHASFYPGRTPDDPRTPRLHMNLEE